MTTKTRPSRQELGIPELPAELDRRFDAFVLDWDGTAVPDRQADASGIRAAVERLCALGAEVHARAHTTPGVLALGLLDVVVSGF